MEVASDMGRGIILFFYAQKKPRMYPLDTVFADHTYMAADGSVHCENLLVDRVWFSNV